MDDLTDRQTDILKALIKEYTDNGEAIGSEVLEKKYKLGVSPATIRNEMVELANKGYLKKEYFSAGRVPSAKGFRFYIKHLMKEKQLSTGDEVAYKNGIWDERKDVQRLIAHATKVLAQRTGLIALAVTDSGDLYYAGVGNLLSSHEFLNLELSQILLSKLDELNYWGNIEQKLSAMEGSIIFMLGEDDFNDPRFEACGSIFGEFEGDKIRGMIGVVGPKRMYYDTLTPQIKYFSNLIKEIMQEQKI